MQKTSIQDVSLNDLDAEITKLLLQKTYYDGKSKNIFPARNLYQKATGKSEQESYYYVMRFDFFRRHKNADDASWQLEWKECKKSVKTLGWLFMCIAILIPIGVNLLFNINITQSDGLKTEVVIGGIFTIIFFIVGISYFNDLKKYKQLGL